MTAPKIIPRADVVAIVTANAELVEMLDAMYPEKLPSPTDGPAEMWMQAGARDVVRKLKFFLEEGRGNAELQGLPSYRVSDAGSSP